MLTLPPLRARPEDIPLLANYFIDKYRNDVPQDIHGLSETARADLLNHARPGNVRMLENAIVRSMIMQEKDGLLKHIIFEQDELNLGVPETAPENPLPSSPDPQYEGSLEARVANYERHLIETALDTHQGILPPRPAALTYRAPRYSTKYKNTLFASAWCVIDIGQRHRAAGKAISLRYAFPCFPFRSGTAPLWRRHYVMNPEVEVLLVYVFGDIYPVKYRTFKLLDIRVFRAYGFDQIVQIPEDKPVCADDLTNLIHLATMRDQLIGGRHINAIDVGKRISGAADAR